MATQQKSGGTRIETEINRSLSDEFGRKSTIDYDDEDVVSPSFQPVVIFSHLLM